MSASVSITIFYVSLLTHSPFLCPQLGILIALGCASNLYRGFWTSHMGITGNLLGIHILGSNLWNRGWGPMVCVHKP